MFSSDYYFEPGFLQGFDPDVKLRKLKKTDTSHTLLYKYCYKPSLYKEYEICFRYEFLHMHRLETYMQTHARPGTYNHFFPSYYETGTNRNGQPYLVMDYIPGDTLENVLRSTRVASPHPHFTCEQILYLFQQLDQAQFWLRQAGLLQLDLSPGNIIVCNQNLDIRLIDFTDAYYISPKIRRVRALLERRHHIINGFADRSLPPAQQLEEAGALLFTQLFYCGQEDYLRTGPFVPFFDQYSSLLNCLHVRRSSTDPEDASLTYWTRWITELTHVLSPV